jgi:hypothetical protein
MSQISKWMVQRPDGVLVRLYIQPKASRSEISGQYGDGDLIRLKVRVAAPPVDGAANEELIRFLRGLTGLPASRIHLIRGESSRAKDILLQGVSLADAMLWFER